MSAKSIYDYENNILNFVSREGIRYFIELRGNITIVDGDSGTGKTLLANELSALKNSDPLLTGIDAGNIKIFNSFEMKITDDKVLYVIDRADRVLNPTVCSKICDCMYARFLIFAREAHNLGVSPNHFGIFKKEKFIKAVLTHISGSIRGDFKITDGSLGKCWLQDCEIATFTNKEYRCKNFISNFKGLNACEKLTEIEQHSLCRLTGAFSTMLTVQ
ncbi:MAG: hypothetical protein SPG09_06185 [Lachnospiraceae bacterium]|nr:hypothetical protein [bacterium]MDY5517182.1 hypothetical protein [Lachnospiraceae bacterium]